MVAGADEEGATWQSDSRSGASTCAGSIESLRGALRSTGGGDASCERTMLAPPVLLARAPAARALRSERHPGGCLALGEDVCCAQSEDFPWTSNARRSVQKTHDSGRCSASRLPVPYTLLFLLPASSAVRNWHNKDSAASSGNLGKRKFRGLLTQYHSDGYKSSKYLGTPYHVPSSQRSLQFGDEIHISLIPSVSDSLME